MDGDGVFLGEDEEYSRWDEYERRKGELPPLSPSDYEKAIEAICKSLNV